MQEVIHPIFSNSTVTLRYSLRSLRLCGSFIFLLLLLGCGDGKPETVPVTGEVVYKNAPVAGAEVTFLPEGGALAMGVTDAAGKFTLRTFAAGDGAIAATHRVTVIKNVVQPATADNPYPMGNNELPAKYARADQSGLEFEVKPQGENHFRLELVD